MFYLVQTFCPVGCCPQYQNKLPEPWTAILFASPDLEQVEARAEAEENKHGYWENGIELEVMDTHQLDQHLKNFN